MNLKVISRNVGFALLASAFFMLMCILVSLAEGNDSALAALTISFTITFTVGIFPFIFVRKSKNISLKDGYMIIVLAWLLSFVFGMLPYLLWGGPFSVINALFESVSGYTTTGATVLANVEALPDSLLLWRSSTHFIGGLGVVVFLLLIIPSSSPVRLRLTNMEISSLSREGYRSRTNKTVFIFTVVYLGLALASFLSYMVAGMPAFDALNHAFSVSATGGFSTKNLSIGAYGSPMVNAVTIVFMFLSSIHFGLIYMTVANRSLKPLNNPVLKFYVMTILVASLVTAFTLRAGGTDSGLGESLMDGFFHVTSFISTTGFAISDNSSWPMFACMIMILVSIPCGMAGSTTGGIKSDRILLLFKSVSRQIRRSIHPSSINQVHIGTHILKDEEIYPHIVFIGLYFILVCCSTALCILSGLDVENSFSASVSSLSNVGPALGDLGTFGNYNDLPVFTKLIFITDMFLGRLEFYPVFAVVLMAFKERK